MYNTKYFLLEELVSQEHLKKFTVKQLWRMFDDRILKAIDLLRKDIGPIVINNWKWGGELDDCGLRFESFYSSPSVSQHLYGRAMDLHPKDMSPKDTRNFIIKNQEEYRPYISRIENNTDTWVHIDICNSDTKEIILF